MSDDLLSDAFSVYFRYNWAKVGTVYSKMSGHGELRNSRTLPRNMAKFAAENCGPYISIPSSGL